MLKMSDIATRAGVSSTTVSFVLNDHHAAERISEKTRIKVLAAAEELGYRSNQMARAMRTGNTLMLGMLGGDTSEESVGRMITGALQAADENGYTLKILRGSLSGSAQQVIRRCSELRLMGVLALHLSSDTLADLHTEARQYGYPLVLLDARAAQPDIAQVVSDDAMGIAEGVRHLVEMGHKRIAFISGEQWSTLSILRETIFAQEMKAHGLEVPDYSIVRGDYHQRAPSIEAAKGLLEMPVAQRPTAIFCSGDLIALATMQVAHSLQLSVPRDISIIGFADFAFSSFSTPQLTTVAQPFVEMGRAAVQLLLDIIEQRGREEEAKTFRAKMRKNADHNATNNEHNGHRVLEPSCAVKMLPTRFLVRETTAPPRNTPA